MKKFKLLVCIVSLLFAVSSLAVVSYSSNTISGSKQVVSGKGAFIGVLVMTDGTNAATVTCYDGTDTTGKVLAGSFVVAGSSRYGGGTFEIPVRYDTGIYIAISGTGASAIVYYTPEL